MGRGASATDGLFVRNREHTARLRGDNTDLPFAIPQASRFEHMHILAGSGHGKTQTLQSLILRDLTADDPPGMVVNGA